MKINFTLIGTLGIILLLVLYIVYEASKYQPKQKEIVENQQAETQEVQANYDGLRPIG